MNTHLPDTVFTPMALPLKIISIVLIAVFMVIGLVGLVLPIIPGALFLFLAALLATRVSPRVAARAHQLPWFRKHMLHWRTTGGGAMFKLTLLLAVRSGLKALRMLGNLFRAKR
jgi:uncharacterized membrane protein YbaN (DUF454 family)